MADISTVVSFEVQSARTKVQDKLIKMLNDDGIRVKINTVIKDKITPFVPKKSEALRESAEVTPTSISWGKGLTYGHYQYTGIVYGPNFPIKNAAGQIIRWYSPRGKKKYPTDRLLQYKTPGTRSTWDKAFADTIKLEANQEITRILKNACKERGLKT
jgi:hypothetical protein